MFPSLGSPNGAPTPQGWVREPWANSTLGSTNPTWLGTHNFVDLKQLRSKFSLIKAISGQIEIRSGFTTSIPADKDVQHCRRWISAGGNGGGWRGRAAEAVATKVEQFEIKICIIVSVHKVVI
ncbi:hypothetical protein CRG98_034824 [Punica granatum]|uniref:Uncharacterized protein n=1 Tax=Punica granatum TaxID=22663 RepID=A0A2I0INB4_PUNGR|nr:hypothetical protein CRG98_034824 [Punica granatum]